MDRRPYIARPYCALMTEHILDVPRCALWADMGMGKTVATLTALDTLFLAGEDHPTLVIAPLRVARDTWPDEVNKWDHFRHLSIMPIIGSEESTRRRALQFDTSIHTINYDNLVWLVEYFGDRWPYRTIVLDESTRVKNLRISFRTHPKTGKVFLSGQGGKRARSLGKIAHTQIKRVIELTGTPSPNGLHDIWGQMWFLDAGIRLGRTYDSFKQRWFQKSFNGYGLEPLPLAQEQIQDRLRDLCLTIDPKDWFDLDDPIVNNIYIDLPAKARKQYNDMERQMFAELSALHSIEALNAAARTQKCLQLANGAAYLGSALDPGERAWHVVHDVKLEALESCVAEANGAPLMVSYEFKSDLARIMKKFPEAVNLATRDGLAAFKTGKVAIGCAHPQSLGHGVDGLQNACNRLVFFGHNWNLEYYDQIKGRIGPIRQMQAGLDRPVFITHIIARNTVDEDVMLRRESKREVQDVLKEAMKRRKP